MARTPDIAATKRPRKSPAERAQADLDSAVKRRDKAAAKLATFVSGIDELRAEVSRAEAEVDFRSRNPALLRRDVAEAMPADEV